MVRRNKTLIFVLSAFLLGVVVSGSKLEKVGETLYSSWNEFLDFVKPSRVHTVSIKDGSFEPNTLEIKVNELVVFINKGESQHWPASNFHPTHEVYPEFNSREALAPGNKWEFRFRNIGTWYYHDHLNPKVGGKIAVYGRKDDRKLTDKEGKRIMDEIVRVGEDYPKVSVLMRDLTRGVGSEKAIKLLNGAGIPPGALSHFLSHKIGEVSYEMYGKDSLGFCEHDTLNGCVHGAIITAISDIGFEGVVQMVRACKELSEFKYQMCAHGAGHAFSALADYDIFQAIENCDLLAKAEEENKDKVLGWCSSGLFMENVHGEHGGLLPFNHPYLSRDNLLYPCDIVSEVYRPGCYKSQAGWWYQIFAQDIQKTANYCLKIPFIYRDECSDNIGRLINSAVDNDLENIRQNCKFLPPPWENECIKATAKSLLTIGEMRMPFELCKGIVDTPARDSCFSEVISDLKTHNLPEEDFDRLCGLVDAEYDDLCTVK